MSQGDGATTRSTSVALSGTCVEDGLVSISERPTYDFGGVAKNGAAMHTALLALGRDLTAEGTTFAKLYINDWQNGGGGGGGDRYWFGPASVPIDHTFYIYNAGGLASGTYAGSQRRLPGHGSLHALG